MQGKTPEQQSRSERKTALQKQIIRNHIMKRGGEAHSTMRGPGGRGKWGQRTPVARAGADTRGSPGLREQSGPRGSSRARAWSHAGEPKNQGSAEGKGRSMNLSRRRKRGSRRAPSRRGFAVMNPELQREIARRGGRASTRVQGRDEFGQFGGHSVDRRSSRVRGRRSLPVATGRRTSRGFTTRRFAQR